MSAKVVLQQAPEFIRFDAGSYSRANIGYVLLAAEQDDVVKLRPAGAGKSAICNNQAMIWDCLLKACIEGRF